MTIMLLITALCLSGIAAFYAVSGLVAIFAAAAVPIAIMGGALEAAKLVVASWLYRRWNDVNLLTKTYFTIALIVLMLLTSMGIFGYLSKAHLDQAGESGVNELQIAQIERQITREQKKITDAELVIAQLDAAVEALIQFDRIRGKDGAIATRENQKAERDSLNGIIESATTEIVALEERRFPLAQSQLDLELEVGPLKYVAELIYGDEAKSHFDETVRWVIMLIIFVFDPLAVMLVIAWNRELSLTSTKPTAPKSPKTKPKTDYWTEVRAEKERVWGEIAQKDSPEPEEPVAKLDELVEESPISLNKEGNGTDIYESIGRGKQGRPDRFSTK